MSVTAIIDVELDRSQTCAALARGCNLVAATSSSPPAS